MSIEAPDKSAQFEQSVRRALGVLTRVRELLEKPRTGRDSTDDELQMLHLSSRAMLAQQRGQHLLIGGQTSFDRPADGHVFALLAAAYDELVAMPTPISFQSLQFVSDIAAVLQGVKRHVERH